MSDEKIVELKTRPKHVQETVVARLEDALKMAKDGRLKSVAIAAVGSDDSVWTSWSETDNFAMMLGAVSRLSYRINETQEVTLVREGDEP